jgi:hypothetical protein
MQTLEVLRHFTARDEVRVERREQTAKDVSLLILLFFTMITEGCLQLLRGYLMKDCT